MGFLKGGPFYHLVGRTGNNVGRIIRGKNVFSMRPSPSSKPPTQPQLNQRAKFAMISSFLSWVTGILEVGFQAYDTEISAVNAAVSYNLMNAVTGVAPNFSIDYTKVLFSRGKLSGPLNPAVASTVAAELVFDWAAGLVTNLGAPTDQATIVVYNPDKELFVTKVNAAARSVLTYNMELPADFSGDTVFCYLSFIAADGKMASTSHAYSGVAVL